MLALLCAGKARANDASISGVGGSVVALRTEHPSVQMVRETVRLDLYKGYYETTADFVFKNHGSARTVRMGFPERGEGEGKQGIIQNFWTSVDGKRVTAQRIRTRHSEEEYSAYWVKSVPFGKNGERHVRVHFRTKYGGGIGDTLAAYDFTGGNWRGKVRESVLIITPHQGAPPLPFVQTEQPGNCKVLARQDARKPRQYVWHSWEAEAILLLSESERKYSN
ncbi:hypothetical protein [Armatimonas rosea]|uniref:Uncharacterized protein n=1 Tax=Armatimonas rosea TaxID=685828 RepID=A0A7W9SL39_ARMRO|nr:hypothetical protein [Armatimonas rosea]MBB6048637.1 hypothetical protein [Armatimonas rosea]